MGNVVLTARTRHNSSAQRDSRADNGLYLSLIHILATKIEAIRGRGGDDLRFSHDFEDLIYVLNNCEEIVDMFDAEKNEDLTSYLSIWANEMLARKNGQEEIECALPYGDYERFDHIFEIISHFAEGHRPVSYTHLDVYKRQE